MEPEKVTYSCQCTSVDTVSSFWFVSTRLPDSIIQAGERRDED